MTAKETFKVLKQNKGILYAIKFFIPFRIVKNQVLIMMPFWYNGNFSMKSINRIKGE